MNKKILISILIISLFTISAALATADEEIADVKPIDNTPTSTFDFNSVFKPIYGADGQTYPQNLSGIILYPKMENGQLVPNMLAHYRINYQEGTYEIIDSFPGNYSSTEHPAAGSDIISENNNNTNSTNSTNQTTNNTDPVTPPVHTPEKQKPINDTKNNEMKKTGGPIVALLLVGTLLSIVGLRRRD